jgi:hypothetical protein
VAFYLKIIYNYGKEECIMQNFNYTKITTLLSIFSLVKVPQLPKKKSNKKIDPIYNDWKKIGFDMQKGIIEYDKQIRK